MDEQEYIAKRFPSIKPRDQYTAAVVLYTANNTFVRLEEAEEAKLFLEREMNALEPDYHYLINLEEIQLPTTYEELFRHDPTRLKFSGITRVILTAEDQPSDNDEGPILCGFYFKPEN